MLLFNGSLHSLDQDKTSFHATIFEYILEQCDEVGLDVEQVDLSKTTIPMFDPYDQTANDEVDEMIEKFMKHDVQIWVAPLYHGSIPGVMKNALDWLQLTSQNDYPYLTNKNVGLICMADGSFGVQGINAMTSIAHTLRAAVLPYSIPINKSEAKVRNPKHLARHYQDKIKLMVQLLKDKSA